MIKARKDVEDSMIGTYNSTEKRKLRALVVCCKEIVRNKEGKCVSIVMIKNERT